MSKVILIIGSSGGLGKHLTRWLSAKGHTIAGHYLNHKPATDSGCSHTYKANITKEDEVKTMVDQVIRDFGHIDAVINNAGISKSGLSWKTPLETWEDTIAVNLTGSFLVAKHVIPHMREQNKGRIIFISSVVAQTGFAGTAAYAASKAGIIGLTKTLAREVAPKNITVNAIAPGYFSAGMIQDVSPEIQEQLRQQIPNGNLGNPDEIAQLADYIISDQSSYLNGQVINLNGGLYM